MSRQLVVQALGIVLGAGLLRFLIDLFDVRRKQRQEPAETGGIVATGAEKAVLSMGKSLEAAERRIAALEADVEHLEKTNADKDARIAQLEGTVDRLRAELDPILHRPQGSKDRCGDG